MLRIVVQSTLGWFVFLLAPSMAIAADRVWVAPPKPSSADSTWYPGVIKPLEGEIVQLDAKALRLIVTGDQAETLIAAHQVLWVKAGDLSKAESIAIELFFDAKYDKAVRPLLDALEDRPPVWRQQWLSMLAANAAWKSRRAKIALELVAQLDARPLPPMTIAWLPINWDGSERAVGAVEAAQARLNDPSPATQLVAASWLLSSPVRAQAKQTLNQLAIDNKRPAIARLAEILVWRTATPPEVKENAAAWQAKVDALPIAVQTGPLRTLIEKFDSAGLEQQAKRLRLSLELTPVIPNESPN